jgi:hypothetical protein
VRFGLLLLIAFGLSLVSGCQGCRSFVSKDPSEDEAKTKESKDEVTQRIELSVLQSLPASSEGSGLYLKAGHWQSLRQTARANDRDESLLVQTSAVTSDVPFRPLASIGERQAIEFQRPVSLTRGQRKVLGFEVFFPTIPVNNDQNASSSRRASIRMGFLPKSFGAAVREDFYPTIPLEPYQNIIVVFATEPTRFRFVSGLSCINWPSLERDEEDRVRPYVVQAVRATDAETSLPSTLLSWTTSSHFIWNDAAPTSLTPKQQQAMVDWLHFGGQIIVNGPDAYNQLKDSFLAPYLPLSNAQGAEPQKADLKRFSQYWTVAPHESKELRSLEFPANRQLPFLSGSLRPGSYWIANCDGFVAERSVGTGRVIMSTFPIDDQVMITWPSFGSFVNSAILGQPNRTWANNRKGDGEESGDMLFAASGWKGLEQSPTVSTRLRFLSRDLGKPSLRTVTSTSGVPKEVEVCGFDGESPTVNVLADELKRSSGISVPKIRTVFILLAGYILALVPANWLFFRVIGRLEWAWLAAPFIAIGGAVAVAKSIQLEIGFTRSHESLNILDLQSGYARGHATSVHSIYTSLSTNYDLLYPDNDGVLLPLVSSRQNRLSRATEILGYDYNQDFGSGFRAFPILSNKTSFFHGEQLCQLEGPIELKWKDDDSLAMSYANQSSLAIHDFGVVARSLDGVIGSYPLGLLVPQAEGNFRLVVDGSEQKKNSTNVSQSLPYAAWKEFFSGAEPPNPSDRQLDRSKAKAVQPELMVEPVIIEILRLHRLEPGDALGIGWTEQPLSKLRIEPATKQSTERSLIVVRLTASTPTVAQPDRWLPPRRNKAEESEKAEPN